MKLEQFNKVCKEFLKEDESLDQRHAQKMKEEQNFSYYSGPVEDVMFIDDLDASNLKRKILVEGKQFKTVHVARREDAVKYDYPNESGHVFYVFYEPQDFTKPALIPF